MNTNEIIQLKKPGIWISSIIFLANLIFNIIILSTININSRSKIFISINIIISFILGTSFYLKLSSYKLITSFSFRYKESLSEVRLNPYYIFMSIMCLFVFSGLIIYISFAEFNNKDLFSLILVPSFEILLFITSLILFIFMQRNIISKFENIEKIVISFKYKKDNYNNTYLLRNNNNTAIVIDCGGATSDLIRFCNLFHIKITDIFITHFHFDHIKGLQKLYNFNNKIQLNINSITNGYFYGDDNSFNIKDYIKDKIGIEKFPDFVVKLFNSNDEIKIGNITIKTIIVKGHTPDSSFFIINDMNSIFVGDTLFADGSVGMHEFEYTNLNEFNDSINNIKNLYNEYNIYPGHYQSPFIVKSEDK